MKKAALFLGIILACLLFQSMAFADNNVDFIHYSDTHISDSASLGSDGFNSTQRYSMLLNKTNNINANFMVNTGDLATDSSNQAKQANYYTIYMNVSAISKNKIYNIKGNHDSFNALYQKNVGPLNWVYRYDDILIVGIGSLQETFSEWLTTNGTTYNLTTFSFLSGVIQSSDYQQTKYHFLFQHYTPNSSWPIPPKFFVPSDMNAFYPYFNVVFCGHEGGAEFTKNWLNETQVVKTAHLGDDKNSTDSFLTVRINRSTGVISVESNNFITGRSYVLYTSKGTPSSPIITILSPENKTYNNSSIPLNFTTTNSKPITWTGYSFDGNSNITLTGNTTLTGLSEGTHNIIVYANDSSGKIGKSNVYFTVKNYTESVLASYWKFDEGSGSKTFDSSGNGNNGTIFNSSRWTTGKVGKALSFDGAHDYVSIPDSSVFNITNEVTISAWVYALTNQSTGGSNQIIQRIDWGNKKGFFLREGYNQSHVPNFYVGNGTYWSYVSASYLKPNGWYLLTASVKANDKIKIYVNGSLISQKNFIGNITQSVGKIKIGYEASTKAFNGTIDEVKIWNRTLSDDEVKNEYAKYG